MNAKSIISPIQSRYAVAKPHELKEHTPGEVSPTRAPQRQELIGEVRAVSGKSIRAYFSERGAVQMARIAIDGGGRLHDALIGASALTTLIEILVKLRNELRPRAEQEPQEKATVEVLERVDATSGTCTTSISRKAGAALGRVQINMHRWHADLLATPGDIAKIIKALERLQIELTQQRCDESDDRHYEGKK